MPRLNRCENCGLDEVQVFHLINRCARRTYLCGRTNGRDGTIRTGINGFATASKNWPGSLGWLFSASR